MGLGRCFSGSAATLQQVNNVEWEINTGDLGTCVEYTLSENTQIDLASCDHLYVGFQWSNGELANTSLAVTWRWDIENSTF